MRSPSQTHATSAPNSGTVAFRMEASPVVMCSTAQEYSANGMAEFTRPASNAGFQCRRSAGHWPWCSRMGNRKKVASSTRSPAVGKGPNSDAPMRMNKKEAPHRAESRANSPIQEETGAWLDCVVMR